MTLHKIITSNFALKPKTIDKSRDRVKKIGRQDKSKHKCTCKTIRNTNTVNTVEIATIDSLEEDFKNNYISTFMASLASKNYPYREFSSITNKKMIKYATDLAHEAWTLYTQNEEQNG